MRTDFTRRLLSGRLILGWCVMVWLIPPLLQAQVPLANPDAMRAEKAAATTTFFDTKRADAERLEAAQKLGYPEADSIPGFLAVGTDRAQSDAVRRVALGFVPYRDKFLDAAVKILEDPEDGGEELDAGLIEDINRRTTFRIPVQDQQRIQNVERKLLGDKRDKVRLYAYRTLVANHDTVAINQLVDSLRQGRDVPIPLPDAIQLLDDDGAASYIGALRPYLSHEDAQVRARAAHALAIDPDSRQKIVELATNPQSPPEVRLNALRGLANADAGFGRYAISLLENAKDDPKIRLGAMEFFTGRMNYNKVDPEEQIRFARVVQKVAAEEAARDEEAQKLRAAAKELVVYLKKAFPALQRIL